MKKLISLLLVLAIAMSLCTVVLADDNSTPNYTATKATSFNITKKYETTEANKVIPAEKISFTVTPDENNPDKNAKITVGDNNEYSVTPNEDLSYSIPVNLPSYSVPGTYQYTIVENNAGTAGMTYAENKTIYVTVLVTVKDAESLQLAVSYYIKNETTQEKSDSLTNKFQTGAFTVKKDVTGDSADENLAFPVKVTLTSDKKILTDISFAGKTITPTQWSETETGSYTYEETLYISDSQGAITFDAIPLGVEVAVEETDAGYYTLENYTVGGVNTDNNGKTAPQFTIMSTDTVAVVITNSWNSTPGTGILLDNLPYILMLALACGGALLLVRRRRAEF